MSENVGYTPYYSHLVGIMIINHWSIDCRLFFIDHIWKMQHELQKFTTKEYQRDWFCHESCRLEESFRRLLTMGSKQAWNGCIEKIIQGGLWFWSLLWKKKNGTGKCHVFKKEHNQVHLSPLSSFCPRNRAFTRWAPAIHETIHGSKVNAPEFG